jgi:hypothetical protein
MTAAPLEVDTQTAYSAIQKLLSNFRQKVPNCSSFTHRLLKKLLKRLATTSIHRLPVALHEYNYCPTLVTIGDQCGVLQMDNSNEQPGFSEKPRTSGKSSKLLIGNRGADHYIPRHGHLLFDPAKPATYSAMKR